MDAERGHSPGRAFRGVGPPGLCRPPQIGREIAFQMQDLAQPAFVQDRPQRDEIGREPPVVADGEGHPRLVDGADGGVCVRGGEGQRLFAEDVLARLGRRHDLGAVNRMRRRQHDGVDGGIGQHRIVIGSQRQPLGRGVILDLRWRARDGTRKPDGVGPFAERIDQRLAPATEADNGRVYHGQASVFSRGTSMSYQGLLSRVLVSSTWSALTSVYSFKPSSPNSRPMPDCL